MTTDEPDPYGDDEVQCTECHRPLREPGSRALGLGPVCRRGRRDLTHAGPGQIPLDLDLPDHLEIR